MWFLISSPQETCRGRVKWGLNIDFYFALIACWLLHFNKAWRSRKMTVKTKSKCIISVMGWWTFFKLTATLVNTTKYLKYLSHLKNPCEEWSYYFQFWRMKFSAHTAWFSWYFQLKRRNFTNLPSQNVAEEVWRKMVGAITSHSHCSTSSMDLMVAGRNSRCT